MLLLCCHHSCYCCLRCCCSQSAVRSVQADVQQQEVCQRQTGTSVLCIRIVPDSNITPSAVIQWYGPQMPRATLLLTELHNNLTTYQEPHTPQTLITSTTHTHTHTHPHPPTHTHTRLSLSHHTHSLFYMGNTTLISDSLTSPDPLPHTLALTTPTHHHSLL